MKKKIKKKTKRQIQEEKEFREHAKKIYKGMKSALEDLKHGRYTIS